MALQTFAQVLARFKNGPVVGKPKGESWPEHIRRITKTNTVHVISEKDYRYWLEIIPPRWMHGSDYCFAEGEEAFRLYWCQGNRYFCRQLTRAQTLEFCCMARIHPPLLAPEVGGNR